MAKAEIVKEKMNLPVGLDLESMAGAGLEAVSVKDIAIPFLKILQDLSPEVKKTKAEYIEGAEPGLICNTVTGELYKEIRVIPCYIVSVINEWKPNRGGYVATHDETSPVVTSAQHVNNGRGGTTLQSKAGNDLVDTTNWYVLIEGKDGDWSWAVMALTMTALKKSRKFVPLLKAIRVQGENGSYQPPLYSHIVKVSTVTEQKDSNEWFNWKFEIDEKKSWDISHEVFNNAKYYYSQVSSKNVVAVPQSEGVETTDVY